MNIIFSPSLGYSLINKFNLSNISSLLQLQNSYESNSNLYEHLFIKFELLLLFNSWVGIFIIVVINVVGIVEIIVVDIWTPWKHHGISTSDKETGS